MKISLQWLNSLLDRPCHLEEAEHALTFAGFPLDGIEALADGDYRLDVEITSNRGDCLCHVGLAREIAAATGRRLVLPTTPTPTIGRPVGEVLTLINETPEACPRFTASVIENARIGPSPDWLRHRLESVGQRPINNAVDVTNWLNFAFGHPSHVFDLDRLEGHTLIVRWAREGEPLRTLDEKPRRLTSKDLVVADAARATSLAGVIGGGDSEVTSQTRRIVLEAATWSPAVVRATARRHQVRTDASHRFERIVDPRPLEGMNRLAAGMIAELTGGTLREGVLVEGQPDPETRRVSMRPSRCRLILGTDAETSEMIRVLDSLGLNPAPAGNDRIACTIPAWRHADLTREIDLIEEVARIRGYDQVPLAEKLPVTITQPQESERAAREIGAALAALGFHETITFSFLTREQAAAFLPPGLELVGVDENRRPGTPILRPSAIASLLQCLRTNHDARNEAPGGMRLFEIASAYAQAAGTRNTVEHRNLSLILETPGVSAGKRATTDQVQHGFRLLRGAIEVIARTVAGPDSRPVVTPAPESSPAWQPGSHGVVSLDDRKVGVCGVISDRTLALFDLQIPVVAADLNFDLLIERYPPVPHVRPLPTFPGIERDLSIVVAESVRWTDIEAVTNSASLARLESVRFVGTYRGKQVGEGRKSVTFRLAFRDPDRTLRSEEIEPEVDRLVAALRDRVGGELRA